MSSAIPAVLLFIVRNEHVLANASEQLISPGFNPRSGCILSYIFLLWREFVVKQLLCIHPDIRHDPPPALGMVQ